MVQETAPKPFCELLKQIELREPDFVSQYSHPRARINELIDAVMADVHGSQNVPMAVLNGGGNVHLNLSTYLPYLPELRTLWPQGSHISLDEDLRLGLEDLRSDYGLNDEQIGRVAKGNYELRINTQRALAYVIATLVGKRAGDRFTSR